MGKLPYLLFLKNSFNSSLFEYPFISFLLAIYTRYMPFMVKEKKNFLTELFALIYSINLFKPTITLDCADVILIT